MNLFKALLVITAALHSVDAECEIKDTSPVQSRSAARLHADVVNGYFIVKFKDSIVHDSIREAKKLKTDVTSKSQVFGYSVIEGLHAEHKRTLPLGADLIKVDLQGKSADHMLIELMNSGQFQYVDTMQIYYPFDFDEDEYNDTNYVNQNYFGNWSNELKSGSGYAQLRSFTKNNLGRKVRVAVIDTGSYRHEDVDFVGGYDFVTYEGVDSNGDIIEVERDDDPTDEYFNEDTNETCNSGHGLAVSSIIAAKANNGAGIVGAVDASMVDIVPVRALGCNGGGNVDIIESVFWAAGGTIDGVPDIAEPVDIVNMSLGGFTNGGCSEWMQEVFDHLYELGVTVVVAAGNEDIDVVNTTPASCARVIAVAATDKNGDKASFSNYGDRVDLSTIGTDIVTASLSTSEDNRYSSGQGTSYAAPLVASTAASLLLTYPTLTREQIEAVLKSNVVDNREFEGAETICGRRGCGVGILEAQSAITAVGNASNIKSYSVTHRYEGYDSDAQATWLQAMSAYVPACDLIQYKWGNLGTAIPSVSYKLFLTESSGEKTEIETVTIPQKTIEAPQNAVLSVQACVDGSCGEIVDMQVEDLTYPAVCSD